MDNDSYSRLFEIANKNMQQSGKTIQCRKAAFFYYIESDPYIIDVLELIETEVSNEEFIYIAYMAFFDRIPDESVLRHYEILYSLPSLEFRHKIIWEFENSMEFKGSFKKILNFIDETECPENSKPMQKIMAYILPIYKKLPMGLKGFIKRIMGADEL